MRLNPYQHLLNEFFNKLLELRHSANHISHLLKGSANRVEKINPENFLSASSLIISDWTGETDNGWTINFHTGASRIIKKADYTNEIERLISNQCCYTIAQSFEVLESFMKDCVYEKANNRKYLEEIKRYLIEPQNFDRSSIPGGEKLFKILRKSCLQEFDRNSSYNNNNIRFKEFWTVLSDCRHAITHSSGRIKKNKIKWSTYHFDIFNHFFNSQIDDDFIKLTLTNKQADKLIKSIAEFAFQIFKSISKTEELTWHRHAEKSL